MNSDVILKIITELQDKYIFDNNSLKEYCQIAIHKLIILTNSKYGFIYEIDNNISKCLAISNVDISILRNSHENINLSGDNHIAHAYAKNMQGQTYFHKNIMSDTQLNENLTHPIITTFMAIPLIFRKKLIGQLGLACGDNYTDSIADCVKPITNCCASAIMSYKLLIKGKTLSQQIIRMEEREKANFELSKTKDEFLANMSHSIRTPLNGIIGMTQLLSETQLDNTQQDFTGTIRQCGLQLVEIINDILDFSKMNAGKLIIRTESFNLRKILEDSYDVIAAKASEKQIDLSYNIMHNVPDFIFSDPKRLKQILVNLLGNAIKCTQVGEIKTNVIVLSSSEDKKIIQFEVSDTGIGIAEEKHQTIFESFNQVDNSYTKELEGSGLGLAINKKLTELMGGETWLKSKINEGSTFYFTITAIADNDAILAALNTNNIDEIKNKKILIVDDNETNRICLTNTFIKWGALPISLGTPHEALLLINSNSIIFDIVILDICMPKMNGIELAIKIKEINSNLSIIAVSSIGDSIDLAGKFQYILTKPIKEHNLLQTCIKILSIENNSKYNTIRKQPYNEIKNNFKILLAEDNSTNQKVTVLMLEKLGYVNIDVAFNGIEALTKVDKKDYDLLILDIKMPYLSGFQVAETVKKRKQKIPLMMAITANALEGDKEKCYEAGMNSYLSKPINKTELETMMEILLKKYLENTNII